jgi:prostamide/prostaglandin F2alpha synthase
MGTPLMADDFRTTMRITAPIWVDEKRVTYKQLQFSHGTASVLNVKSMLNAARALSKGHFQHRTQGNPVQNGGVLVVRKGGECLYAYASEVAGDMPKTAEVLAAARAAR